MIQGKEKAIAAGISTGMLIALAVFGVGDMPPEEEIRGAIMALAGALASGFITWLTANTKPDAPAEPPVQWPVPKKEN